MSSPTTNAAIRKRYEDGRPLNDGAFGNVGTDAPANGADTVVAADTDVHVVTADGTNAVDLSNVATAGQSVTVVFESGVNTPAIAFTDTDFVGTGPADLSAAGATATVQNIDGTASGFVVVAEGSA